MKQNKNSNSKKKKVIIGVVLVVLALLIALGFLLYNKMLPTLSISKESLSLNEEGYFTVSAENFKPEVAAFDFSITFDPSAIEITEIKKGDLDVELAVSREAYANDSGKITVLFVDTTGGDNPIDPDGDILYVTYKPLKPGKTDLLFDSVNIVDSEEVIQNNIKERGGVIEVH